MLTCIGRSVPHLRREIATLSRGIKQWWKLNRELLNKKAKLTSIPPLRDGDTWLADAREKANLFARTFADGYVFSPEVVDTAFFGSSDSKWNDFVALHRR